MIARWKTSDRLREIRWHVRRYESYYRIRFMSMFGPLIALLALLTLLAGCGGSVTRDTATIGTGGVEYEQPPGVAEGL